MDTVFATLPSTICDITIRRKAARLYVAIILVITAVVLGIGPFSPTSRDLGPSLFIRFGVGTLNSKYLHDNVNVHHVHVLFQNSTGQTVSWILIRVRYRWNVTDESMTFRFYHTVRRLLIFSRITFKTHNQIFVPAAVSVYVCACAFVWMCVRVRCCVCVRVYFLIYASAVPTVGLSRGKRHRAQLLRVKLTHAVEPSVYLKFSSIQHVCKCSR